MAKVYKNASGKFVAPVRDPITGERSTRVFDDIEIAKDVCAASEAEWRRNRTAGKTETVEESCRRYRAYLEAKNASRPHLSNAAKGMHANHIEPFFSTMPTREVAVRHLHRFVSYVLDKGLSIQTADNIVSVLSMTLEHAKARKVIRDNPMDEYRRSETKALLESYRQQNIKPMSLQQVRRVLDETTGQIKTLFHVFLLAGVRIGELADLKWGDVDFEKGRIMVMSTSAPKAVESPDGVALQDRRDWKRQKKTKTAPGVRSIPMTVRLARELLAHRAAQGEELPSDDASLFRNPDGSPLRVSQIDYAVRAAQRELLGHRRGYAVYGPDLFTPHELRHTSCALMLAAGMDINVISRRLGHAHPGITMDTYGHFLTGLDRLLRPDERPKQAVPAEASARS